MIGRLIRDSKVEQVSSSGFSFVFYILAANYLGAAEFGLFVALLIPAQIIHTIAYQWVLLPITTSIGDPRDARFIKQIVRRAAYLLVVSPILGALYLRSSGIDYPIGVWLLLAMALTVSLLAFDVARFLSIRVGLIRTSTLTNATRLTAGIVCLIALSSFQGPQALVGALSFIGAQLLGAAILISALSRQSYCSGEDGSGGVGRSKDGNALLTFGFSNAAYTFVVSSVLASANIAAFGAFQAFRSLVNWAPLLLQYLETHFASRLANSGVTSFTNIRWYLLFSAVTMGGLILLQLFGRQAIDTLYGSEFTPFKTILLASFLLVMIQCFTRVLSIEGRLGAVSKAFYIQAAIVVSACLLLFLYSVYRPEVLSVLGVIIFMICVATIQSVAMALTNRSTSDKE